jgi:Phosphatidylglycerophosphate synthase
MNLPNKLTIFRILLIPIMMIVYSINYLRINWILYPNLSIANFIVLLIFFIGVLTDFLDGHIARKHNLVTNFGKFLDPLADKLLTCTAFILLMQQNAQNQALMIKVSDKPIAMASGTYELLSWWMVIIILAREFMVTGIRLLAAGQGKVIAASMYGKIKTTIQFITILFLFAGGAVTISGSYLNDLALWYVIIAKVLIVAMLAITIFSGYDYLVKNIDVLKDVKKKVKK